MEPSRDRQGGGGGSAKKWRRARKRARKQRDNSSNETSSPPQAQDNTVGFQSLMDEITCSVCLDSLENPVYIACGHIFCRDCIATHWDTSGTQGNFCPECRAQCPRNLVPDYRLSSLISKIQLGMQETNTKEENSVPSDHDCPVQLVSADEDGFLRINQSVLYECFLNSETEHYPILLLSIIGENRLGKSFLMNYIMRALRSKEMGEEINLGTEDDPLQGFEWASGVNSITKGIWIWKRPFILNQKGKKIAVYLLDTEGSLDIEGDRDIGIRLSALSMLLSSHLIFNVSRDLKTTELDYMEMYLHLAEVCETKSQLQYMDILVRDWHDSKDCSRNAARSYINQEIKKLQNGNFSPVVLHRLQSHHTRCFLLPHPGKKITGAGQGTLKDMDEDFQLYLRAYVTDVVSRGWQNMKINDWGEALSCAHLPAILQELVELLQKKEYDFASPMEMYYALKNEKTKEEIQKEFQRFLESQLSSLSIKFPNTMRKIISEKRSELKDKFFASLLGTNDDHHRTVLLELEAHLLEEEERSCSSYRTRFVSNAVALTTTVGFGVYGAMGAVAARGAAAIATQSAVAAGERFAAAEIATSAISLLKTGVMAAMGKIFRGGL